ncbi:MAG: ABC transporter permease subunit [Clostridiales bacterium]|nr:ABC transporter permease subunit [Clostridiales bacterium]
MKRNKPIREKTKETIVFCLGILLVGILIQVAGWLKGDRLVFPDVAEILRAFVRLLGQEITWRRIGTTLMHLLEALLAAGTIGLGLGLLQGRSRTVYTLLKPTMIFLRTIPMIVMAVIIMVLAPYPRVPLIATTLMLIPLISEATCEGFRRIEPELVDVYRMNSGFNALVLFRVYLPLMAGYLKQACVNAVGMGIKLVVTTEYLVQTRDSLGKAVYSSSYFNEYEDIYAYALIMVLLALAVSGIPALLAQDRRK